MYRIKSKLFGIFVLALAISPFAFSGLNASVTTENNLIAGRGHGGHHSGHHDGHYRGHGSRWYGGYGGYGGWGGYGRGYYYNTYPYYYDTYYTPSYYYYYPSSRGYYYSDPYYYNSGSTGFYFRLG